MDWSEFYDSVMSCRRCPLCETRKKVVFGEGPRDASILFIGEGPGAVENETGRPFVGRSGMLLSGLMEEAGVSRDSVFITNMVKCRPPENRNPKGNEIKSCAPWLSILMTLLRPKVIVGVGNVPSQSLLKTKLGITSMRGNFYDCRIGDEVYPFMPIFHPAYLLRNRSREEGKPVDLTLRDLKSLQKWL